VGVRLGAKLAALVVVGFGERRILLGSVAYAIPYVALWSLVGLALGDAVRAV
jgi:hypothetical protein